MTAYRSASVVIVVLKYTSNTLNCPEFLDEELFFLYSSDNVNFLARAIYMPLKDVVKVSRKTFFDPRGWAGYDLLRAQFVITWGILKNLFSPAAPTREETFEEAVKRLHLSEEAIQQTSRNYLIFSYVFVLCGLGTLGFSFHLLLNHGTAAGWILGLLSTALFFVFSFRYHFWHFQIKHRKLGCTFAEWRQGKPFDRGEPHP